MVVQQCEYIKCLWIILVKIVLKVKFTFLFQLGTLPCACLPHCISFLCVRKTTVLLWQVEIEPLHNHKKKWCFSRWTHPGMSQCFHKETSFLTLQAQLPRVLQGLCFASMKQPRNKVLSLQRLWTNSENCLAFRELTLELTGARERTTVWQRGESPSAGYSRGGRSWPQDVLFEFSRFVDGEAFSNNVCWKLV